MSTPDPSTPSRSGARDPFGPPPGAPAPPAYGQPSSYAQPGGYGQPGEYGQPGQYGQYGQPAGPAGFGTPAPYGSGGVVGPGGEWLGPPLASWFARLGGYLVDSVLVAAVVVVASLVHPDLGTVANLALFVALGYLTGTSGQTPGRRVMGIKVLRLQDGQVLGAGAGIGRQFLHVLDALPLLLGYFWPLWDKKNQTFADKIIGSVVVKV